MLTCNESAVRLLIVRSNAQTVLGIAMGGVTPFPKNFLFRYLNPLGCTLEGNSGISKTNRQLMRIVVLL